MTLEEAEAKIEELNATNAELLTSVKKLETANAEIVSERKELKEKLKSGATDEVVKAELEKAQALLADREADIEKVKAEATAELSRRDMISMLKDSGVQAPNQKALEEIANIILNDAQYEDGSFKFVDDDGTTRYNEDMKPYSIIDKVNEMKEGDDAFRFIQGSGGGTSGDNPADNPPKSMAGEVKNLRAEFK